jgi:virginiamycin B lyase
LPEIRGSGRITTTGTVTTYTGTGIDSPDGITAGPDGALWFTNEYGGSDGVGSIGQITTTGAVTDYTSTSIDSPQAITAGPDGALWFTNYRGYSIGRITTP